MTFSDQYYHVLNRGNGKEKIFLEQANYLFFLKRLGEYLEKYNTILVCYCLMPNHFHLILKETEENGISHLMLSLQTSYAKAFNKRYERSGHLFQDTYKYIRIDSNEYLVHLSRYIHLNPVKAGLIDKAEDWEFSSYCDYIGLRNGKLPDKEIVLSQFADVMEYKKFVEDQTIMLELDKLTLE